MGSAHGGEDSSRRVRVALVGCTGLLGEIISRTVRDQPDFDVVAAVEPGALHALSPLEADLLVWKEADEAAVAAWLCDAHGAPRVLATLGDGREASLWQLTPQRTRLGAPSPAVLVDTIRNGAPSSEPQQDLRPQGHEMPEHLIWDVTVRADGGPQLNDSGVMEVDAYDKLSVVVPAGDDLAVDLGPAAAGRISCLVIMPTEPSDHLSYDVDGTGIKLNQPQFLFGGAVDLTGNPAGLTFSNAGSQDAAVEIFLGRDATP
ncbi:hypothetical protein FXF50_04615 [Micromonospora sp. AP08]|uniref:hypothetical protein n=1 Tax=Micromonospora sp. AP08 TaxID=2604467 RepID=UPI0011DA5403|nr:hypothetical protein [Micromonospora sp. AP08]TYB39666.1 hypothetical protein FXF50_04615 [Micromonospora sp. AP08]